MGEYDGRYVMEPDHNPRRSRHDRRRLDWSDWVAWLIRLLIPASCVLIIHQNDEIVDLKQAIAIVSVKQDMAKAVADDQARQLQSVWRQVSITRARAEEEPRP